MSLGDMVWAFCLAFALKCVIDNFAAVTDQAQAPIRQINPGFAG